MGQFDAGEAVKLLRSLDTTRLVEEASGWFDQGGGDFDSIHNYFYPLRVKQDPRRAVLLSEYGGIACALPGHTQKDKTYGYGIAKNREELGEAVSGALDTKGASADWHDSPASYTHNCRMSRRRSTES